MKKDDELYRIHICECIERIESYMKNVDQGTFLKTPLIQDAVLRNLQTLSESTQRLSENFKTTHPEIEWYKIAGLRNILVHDYLGIDLETVWNIIEYNLPHLSDGINCTETK